MIWPEAHVCFFVLFESSTFAIDSVNSKTNTTMVKHIVFFKFPKLENREGFLKEFKEKIENLGKTIAEIHSIEAGINFSDRDSAYDVALVSDFKTEKDLETYRVHPDHVALVDFLNQQEREIAVVDYNY